MQQEQEKALDAIRGLIVYYTSDFQEGCGYTGKQPLIYLTRSQAEVALRYGIPIGVRDKRFTFDMTRPEKPFCYSIITDVQSLDQQLADPATEPLASIYADLPRRVQQIMREYIVQIMEIECPERLPPPKPVAPILGEEGNIFNLMCITNRTLRNAGQQEQAEEMWRRVLEGRDHYKAISIMGEYVEFGEAYLPKPMIKPSIQRPRGDLRG